MAIKMSDANSSREKYKYVVYVKGFNDMLVQPMSMDNPSEKPGNAELMQRLVEYNYQRDPQFMATAVVVVKEKQVSTREIVKVFECAPDVMVEKVMGRRAVTHAVDAVDAVPAEAETDSVS